MSAGVSVKCRNNSSRLISGNSRSRANSSTANTCIATKPSLQHADQPHRQPSQAPITTPRRTNKERAICWSSHCRCFSSDYYRNPDLLRTGISIREGRLSSVTLLRRLGNHSRKNRLYKAFRELGRVVRTITLLRFLSEPELREQITAITNRAESFHGFAEWLMFGGRLIGHNDPDHQERVVKFNELVANCAIYSTALDITDAANALAAEGHPVDPDDLATITPYITRTIRRFGD
ncbi:MULTISPECIES: transposase [Nocardia]|uniref:transposase n=1 Tax=Nocardia TaxID=1817 RepID=UPI001F11383B|nr:MULTISPECIES: transposase [Nocardia]